MIMAKKKIVMTFWTFDRFHPGHKDYLWQAKKNGDILTVIVARDQTVLRVKWKIPIDSERVRLQNVQDFDIVDQAFLWSEKDYYAIIWEIRPDVLFFWYDQHSFNNEKLEEYLQIIHLNLKIIIWKAFESEKWKSSKLN